MALPIFPLTQVRGVAWSVIKRPVYSTIEQQSANGRKIRIAQWAAPLWEFDFTWTVLSDNVNILPIKQGNTYTDYITFLQWLLGQYGKGLDFVYQPEDSVQTNVPLTVDSTGNAQLVHYIGNFAEPVQEVNGTNIQVFFNGVLQPAPTIGQPSSIAPYLGYVIQNCPAGQTVTASFNYFYRCQLTEDKYDLEEFMFRLYELKKISIQQVRL